MTDQSSRVDFEKLSRLVGQADINFLRSKVLAACKSNTYVTQRLLAALEGTETSKEQATEVGNSSHAGIITSDDDEEEDTSADEADAGIQAGDIATANEGTAANKRKCAASQSRAGKRQRSPTARHFDTCQNCGQTFETDEISAGSCYYHPSDNILGELELNPTNDYIEDDHESRLTWPNVFEWECCGRNLEEDQTCQIGKHRADGQGWTDFAAWRLKLRRGTYTPVDGTEDVP